jgi:adenylate cyclase
MSNELKILNQILEHRLHQADIDQVLAELSGDDKSALLNKVGELLRRMSALMEVSSNVLGTMGLEDVLGRLIEIITETLVAERSSLFLRDDQTGELFSLIAQGKLLNEIRFAADQGVAGAVFSAGASEIINDPYADPRFNREVDRQTGFLTRNILCVPIRRRDGKVIGVTQVLNKSTGNFTADDESLLEAMTTHAANALESAQLYERVERALQDEEQMMEITSALSSELQLDSLLGKIMSLTTDLLSADRSTLFLHDPATDELWATVAEGVGSKEIRFPASAGIAGSVFSEMQTINIPDAYADPRFNQAVDKATGYHTRNMLCMPVLNKAGVCIGVTQVLNKIGGPFSKRDEQRLRALTAQAAIGLENARLFEDVRDARNYSENILRSLSTGVITLDAKRHFIKLNSAACRILRASEADFLERDARDVFSGGNAWINDSLDKVMQSGEADLSMDTELKFDGEQDTSINLNVVPLLGVRNESIGFMLIIEDISSEKRVRGTMARYMTKEVADRLLEDGASALGGAAQEVTILFSDIRNFTNIAEEIGARETVSMLNDYFSAMVDAVFENKGILDKYIGDAIMALFGAPFADEHDADNALATACLMMKRLWTFNVARKANDHSDIVIGIGINTGEVIAGNIGTDKRMDYTVIGDGVNLAARL